MKNLENFGVQDLNFQETQKIEGGFWQYVVGGMVALTAMGIHDSIDHPGAFWDGFTNGF